MDPTNTYFEVTYWIYLGSLEASYEHNNEPPVSTPVFKRLIAFILIIIVSLIYYLRIFLSGQITGN